MFRFIQVNYQTFDSNFKNDWFTLQEKSSQPKVKSLLDFFQISKKVKVMTLTWLDLVTCRASLRWSTSLWTNVRLFTWFYELWKMWTINQSSPKICVDWFAYFFYKYFKFILFKICEPNLSESKKIGSHFFNAQKLFQR